MKNAAFSIEELFRFLDAGVSAFHSTAAASAILEAEGYVNCPESAAWELTPGGKYYTTRNGSAVLAWRMPKGELTGWHTAASHSDSPTWRIKQFDTEEEKKRQLGAWVTVQRGHAVANGLPVVTVNRVGHEADPSRQTNGIQFWGNSFVAGPQGELLAELSNNDEEIRIVEIDKTRSENVRRWWPFFRDRRIDAFGGLTERFLI